MSYRKTCYSIIFTKKLVGFPFKMVHPVTLKYNSDNTSQKMFHKKADLRPLLSFIQQICLFNHTRYNPYHHLEDNQLVFWSTRMHYSLKTSQNKFETRNEKRFLVCTYNILVHVFLVFLTYETHHSYVLNIFANVLNSNLVIFSFISQ